MTTLTPTATAASLLIPSVGSATLQAASSGTSRASTTKPVKDAPAAGYHAAVYDFKRRLIEATLGGLGGNRTHTARALGLQRTYLLRLMRELRVTVAPPERRRGGAAARGSAAGDAGATGTLRRLPPVAAPALVGERGARRDAVSVARR